MACKLGQLYLVAFKEAIDIIFFLFARHLEDRSEEYFFLCLNDENLFQGHSSFITHLDWSADGQYLRSNSGDYEVLYCK